MKFNVGIAGSRLTLAQRQKLILARSLIKRPDVLIISDGLSSLESSAIAELMIKLLDAMENKCLIWVVPTVSMSKKFDRVVAMRRGKVVKSGSYQELGGSDDNLVKLIEDKVD